MLVEAKDVVMVERVEDDEDKRVDEAVWTLDAEDCTVDEGCRLDFEDKTEEVEGRRLRVDDRLEDG